MAVRGGTWNNMENNMNIRAIFNSGLSYPEYRKMVDALIAEGKTTGNTQSVEKVEFTKLNIQRMNRLDKTIHLPEYAVQEMENLAEPMLWLLIGDAWCGDTAQTLPIIYKLAEASEGEIDLRIISRDSYPGFIQAYSGGSKSIPKLFAIDPQTLEVICSWGSRPKPAREIMHKWKASQGAITHDDFEKELHLWYARDKGLTTINELVNQLVNCEKKIGATLLAKV